MKTHLIPDEEILAYIKAREPIAIAVEYNVDAQTGKTSRLTWPSIVVTTRKEGFDPNRATVRLRSATKEGFQRDLLLAQRFIYGDVA